MSQSLSKPDSYYQFDRAELLTYIPGNIKKVLDVGCGAGNFGALLKDKFGCEVWGIEISEKAGEARQRIDKVINKSFETDIDELKGQLFDVIFFNDVLEHLKEPQLILEQSQKYLKSEGFIFASIPNILYYPILITNIKKQDWKYESAGIMDETHLRFFTRKSIVRMFETCSMEVQLTEGINRTNPSWKFKLFNLLTGFKYDDMLFQQFVILAKKNNRSR